MPIKFSSPTPKEFPSRVIPSPLITLLNLLTLITLIALITSPTCAWAQGYKKERPIIELPIRIYTLEFESAQILDAQTKGSGIGSIIHELNKIYEKAGIKWVLLSGAPLTIKGRHFVYKEGGADITQNSQTIRYRLSRAINKITPRGEYRVYMLRKFPKGETEPSFYDSYLRGVFFAENTEKWGPSHVGMLAQELGIALGLSKVEASTNMMFRRKPRSANPEDNKLLENQILRLRQVAEIELLAAKKLKEKQFETNQSNTNGQEGFKSIFDQ
jgi:hypothetical protein